MEENNNNRKVRQMILRTPSVWVDLVSSYKEDDILFLKKTALEIWNETKGDEKIDTSPEIG